MKELKMKEMKMKEMKIKETSAGRISRDEEEMEKMNTSSKVGMMKNYR